MDREFIAGELLKLARDLVSGVDHSFLSEVASQARTVNAPWAVDQSQLVAELRHTESQSYAYFNQKGSRIEVVVETWNPDTDDEVVIGKKVFPMDAGKISRWLRSLENDLAMV